MKYLLEGRTQKTDPLRVMGSFPTYETAVTTGQQRYGYGNFHVRADDDFWFPSRNQQLLIKPAPSRSDILNSI